MMNWQRGQLIPMSTTTSKTSLVLLERNVPRRESVPETLREPDTFSMDSAAEMSEPPPGYCKGDELEPLKEGGKPRIVRGNHYDICRYWQEQLTIAGRWNEGWPEGAVGARRGLRPAVALLKEYEYLDVLRAIRWWCGPNGLKPGRSFTLEWLHKNMDIFYQRMYRSKH